jgi:hypothetical protein
MVDNPKRADSEHLIARWGDEFRAAIDDAFQAGRQAGRSELSAELARLGIDSQKLGLAVVAAQPDSLRGKVRAVLQTAPGISLDDVEARTGLDRNAARKTLNKLKELGEATKIGELWSLNPGTGT